MTENIGDLIPGMRQLSMRRRTLTESDLTYGSHYSETPSDTGAFPSNTMPARNAYQIVHDSLLFDGDPTLNCATFLTTWMEPEAEKLIMENLGKNRVDIDEYEATERIHRHCLAFLADLWRAPKNEPPTGTVVVGSSEGIMLGGLAMKWRWRERRLAEGKDASKPNIIFGADAQVALEKTARYFDIESRLVPVSDDSRYSLDIHKALEMVDENTIGMYVILGTTYTGHFEQVAEMSQLLEKLKAETGLDIPIHVDGASGAFVAPFAFPNLKWGFDVPHVVSISTSGHKFGLTYPGIGWVLWRGAEYLPNDLTFELAYLGGLEKTFTLNFSHPACFLIAQYYNFIRFGRKGYTRIMNSCLINARLLSVALEATGIYQCVSDIHRPRGMLGYSEENRIAANQLLLDAARNFTSVCDSTLNDHFNYGLPLCAFLFTDKFKAEHPMADQGVVSTLLRVRGWIIPNYPLPPDKSDVEVLRVVVKEATSEDMINRLVRDIIWATQKMLESKGQNLSDVLSHPLPQNISTSDLANTIAQTGKGELKQEDQSAHWENLLSKIGVATDSAASEVPVKRLVDGGRRKTVYEKAC